MEKNNKSRKKIGKMLWRYNMISIICTLLAPILSILVNIYYINQIRLEDKKEIEAVSKIRNVQNILAQVSGRYFLSRGLLSAYYSGDSIKIQNEKNRLSSHIIDWNIYKSINHLYIRNEFGNELYVFFLENIEDPLTAFSNQALHCNAMSDIALEQWRQKLNKVNQSIYRLSENPEFIKAGTEYKSSVSIAK